MITLNNTIIGTSQSDIVVFNFIDDYYTLEQRSVFAESESMVESSIITDFCSIPTRSGSRFVVHVLQWLSIVLIHDTVKRCSKMNTTVKLISWPLYKTKKRKRKRNKIFMHNQMPTDHLSLCFFG